MEDMIIRNRKQFTDHSNSLQNSDPTKSSNNEDSVIHTVPTRGKCSSGSRSSSDVDSCSDEGQQRKSPKRSLSEYGKKTKVMLQYS